MTALSRRRRSSPSACGRSRSALFAVALLLIALSLASPGAAAKLPPPPELSSRSAAVVERSTGRQLYGVDAAAPKLMASTTKMMTALVAVDQLSLAQRCVAPRYAAAAVETQIGLRAGEEMAVSDLLRALMLPSANDAAAALAVCAAGSRSAFVALMNEKARQLGLRATSFSTPVGLDSPTNYSSAADLARIGIAVRSKPFLAKTVDLPSVALRSGAIPRTVVNRNGLVQTVPWVDGIKTGHTNAAGYLLVASATQGGLSFVATVMGAPSEQARDADALALLRWAYASYRFQRPVRAGATVATAPVRHRPSEQIALVASRSVRELVRRDRTLRVTVDAPAELAGPLPRNAVVGTITVRRGVRAIATVPLVTAEAVPEIGLAERAKNFIARPGSLVAIVAVIGGATALWVGQRHVGRRRRGRTDMEAA